jgi:hypothetical protein
MFHQNENIFSGEYIIFFHQVPCGFFTTTITDFEHAQDVVFFRFFPILFSLPLLLWLFFVQ